MGRLPLASEALLSKVELCQCWGFCGFWAFCRSCFFLLFLKKAAVIWLGLLHILGTKTVLFSWQGRDPESGRQCGTWMLKDET